MWVRSQNKNNLIYCTAFYIEDNNIFANSNQIVYGLGRYETEHRTLEVLDQMQKCLFYILDGETHIYEMPQK